MTWPIFNYNPQSGAQHPISFKPLIIRLTWLSFKWNSRRFFNPRVCSGIGGKVSGKLSGSGNLSSLKTLKADVDFSELSLNAKGKTIIEGRNLQLGIQNEAIVIPQNRLTLFQEGTLDIGGEPGLARL